MSREYPTPKHLWIAPDLAIRSKSELRAIVEGQVPLTLVK
jgi:hypothetical protein